MGRGGNAGIAAICLLLAAPADAAALYRVDQRNGTIAFSARMLGMFDVEGSFPRFAGEILLDEDQVEHSHVDVTIDADQVDMPLPDQVVMLRSDAYFDTARYPTSRFVSDTIKSMSPTHYAVHGRLSLRGVTRPEVLDATLLDRHVDAKRHIEVADFVVTGRISRFDFGMVADRVMISDGIAIEIRVRLTVARAPDLR
jgi:polyisoprenoid-binding protein YceI